MFHLLADISAHGYGHVSQTTAVINALRKLVPEIRVTVRSGAPYEFLASRLQGDFVHIPEAFDFGMKMKNAVDVDVTASLIAYRDFHQNWSGKIQTEADKIRELKPDLLLGNVPYLSLAAARQAGVRSVGMCCLNWADIFRHYCVEDAATRSIHAQMLEAYLAADKFLKVEPAMPMPDFTHTYSIAPIVRTGHACREVLNRQFGISADSKLVMVAMGGMDYPLDVQSWPAEPGLHWIVPQAWPAKRPDMIAFESLQHHFTDVLASCDAIITKPGYGTFTEAAYAGVPLLYVTRGDWPEEPYLVEWLQQHGVCMEIDKQRLHRGELLAVLQAAWSIQRPQKPDGDGAHDAARILLQEYL